MRKKVKTKKELLAEIAGLKTRLEEAEMRERKADNNRIGREHAEEALKKAEDGQIKSQNALKQSELQVKYLTSQLLLAEEKERKRIADELHDSLGQSLNAISTSVKTPFNR
jgi:signal transduction histidine kinase